MASNVVVFGATSGIAQAVLRLMAQRGDRFFLIARDDSKLQAVAADLRIRGAQLVSTASADLNDFSRHPPLIAQAAQALGILNVALIAHGILGDQAEAEINFEQSRQIFTTNAVSPMSLLILLAETMRRQRSGTIAVLGSVAGERGRRSNYTYGASKAALSVYLQGLRARLFPVGVKVVEIKAGPIDTPMTGHVKAGLLLAQPTRVAAAILKAIEKGKATAYVPGFWRPIMFVIRHLPEGVNKRLSY